MGFVKSKMGVVIEWEKKVKVQSTKYKKKKNEMITLKQINAVQRDRWKSWYTHKGDRCIVNKARKEREKLMSCSYC